MERQLNWKGEFFLCLYLPPPPEIDLNYYRQVYPELNRFSDDVLREHYKRFAVEQGHSTCIYDRREYLQALLQNAIAEKHVKALEISPANNPFIKGDSVKYFGIMDSEALKTNAEKSQRPVDRVPEKIHFVSPTGDLGVVDEKFDLVFSAHVIEHCPDLIEHFQGVSKILNKGGLYILIVPDKRYCFDYYHSESTLSEVIDAFANERKFPRLADVINGIYTRTHNNAVMHWLGIHGERYGRRNTPPDPDGRAEIRGEYFQDDGKGVHGEGILRLVEKYAESLEFGEYISAHNWRFTPDSFGYIIKTLNELKFIDLPLYRLCHTIWGRQEFIAMLEKL